MKQRRLPIMVSTEQALQSCLEGYIYVIYIDKELYRDRPEKIHQMTIRHGYILADIPARNGVFYTIDRHPDAWEVYDPYRVF